MDQLLLRYQSIKLLHQQYTNELESIKAEIQARLDRDYPSGYFENSNWRIQLIRGYLRRTVNIDSLENAIQNARLTEEQAEIIQQAIFNVNCLSHVIIKEITS